MREIKEFAVLLMVVVIAAVSCPAEVVGKAAASLDGQKVREQECALGNLVADGVRAAVGGKAAFVQASQLRSESIPAGDVDRDALTDVLLYPDEPVVLVELTGTQILAALERSVSMVPKPSTSFLQVSGMTVTFRSDSSPGQRVVEVKIGGAALSPNESYDVAMPASLAKGALGYFRIFNRLEPTKTGSGIGDAVADYVRSLRTILPQSGRMRDLSR